MATEPLQFAKDINVFNSDSPIPDESRDEFGTAKFARGLARAVKGWHLPYSLVIAVHGPWGSGKSSIKNMCLKILEADKTTCPIIIHYSPWLFPGDERVYQGFFKQLSLSIGKTEIEGASEMANGLSNFGRALDAATKFIPFAATLAATVVSSNAGGDHAAAMEAGKLAGEGIKASIETGRELNKNKEKKAPGKQVSEVGKGSEEQPIEKQKEDLKALLESHLAKAGKPIWIVIDDIDRLTADEMLQTFQVVKSMADFRCVHYMLLFDREIVARNLSMVLKIPAQEFLEKIIQVELDTPKIEQRKLTAYLHERLENILDQIEIKQEFDSDRWNYIYQNGLKQFFSTPRNIHRYINTITFYIHMLVSKATLEINPVDFFSLEALRLFLPTVYAQLCTYKRFLAPEQFAASHMNAQPKYKEEAQTFLATALEKFPPPIQDCAKTVLFSLFPQFAKLLGEKQNSEDYGKLYRELRVAHPIHFAKYFYFSNTDDQLSNVDIIAIKDSMSTGESFDELLVDFENKGFLKNALDCISEHLDTIEFLNMQPVVLALLSCGERMDGSDYEDFRHAIYNILYKIIIRLKEQSEREKLFDLTLRSHNFVFMPALIAYWGPRESRVTGDLFSVAYQNKSKVEGLNNIRLEAASDNLPLPGNAVVILRLLKEWGDIGEIQKYTARLMTTDAGIFLLLGAAIQTSLGSHIGAAFSRHKVFVNLAYLKELSAFDGLEEKLNTMDLKSLSDSRQKMVALFSEALKTSRKSGSGAAW